MLRAPRELLAKRRCSNYQSGTQEYDAGRFRHRGQRLARDNVKARSGTQREHKHLAE